MKRDFTVSVFAHGALLLAVLVGLPPPEPFKVEPQEMFQTGLFEVGDEIKLKATTQAVVEKPEKPAAQKTEITKDVKPAPKVAEEEILAAKPKEPEPEPEKVEDKPVEDEKLKELLKAEAEAEQKAVEEAALAEKKAADEKKKDEAEEKKKAEADKQKKAEAEKKKKQKLDVAALDELLNKENEERTAPKKSGATDGSLDQGETEAQGDDGEAKATFQAALQARIKECFNPPPASLDEGVKMLVPVDFTLNPDGTLKAQPQRTESGDFLFDAVGDAAVAAIIECQPYNFFPEGKYKGFARWILKFDPKDSNS